MENQDDLLSFYKELYEKEFERKDHIINSLNIQIGLITIFLTIQFYLITSFDFNVFDIISIAFVIASVLIFAISIVSIYYLILAYSNFLKGHESSGFQTAEKIEKYRKELINYYRNNDNRQDLIEKDFKGYLISEYILHYDSVLNINDKKTLFIFKSKKYSIIGLIIISISIPIYLVNFFTKKDEIRKIKIENLNSIEKNIETIRTKLDTLKTYQTINITDTLKKNKNVKHRAK